MHLSVDEQDGSLELVGFWCLFNARRSEELAVNLISNLTRKVQYAEGFRAIPFIVVLLLGWHCVW